jgi:hypothetical protein
MTQIFETDWLASQPIFYNDLTGKVSHNINDVIDYNNLELDPEGFNNYLDFGYSVLEQTPIKHVKFLRYSSRLTVHDDGKLEIEYLDDPIEKWIDTSSREDDIFHLLYSSVHDWEKSVDVVAARLMGYDMSKIKMLAEGLKRPWLNLWGGNLREVPILSNVNAYHSMMSNDTDKLLGFRPPKGWRGQIEIGANE